jgi:hypothetical protein
MPRLFRPIPALVEVVTLRRTIDTIMATRCIESGLALQRPGS